MTVICPLCVQTCFSSLDALHHRLIKASNGPLHCPICNEVLMGLDKLTIHLFCHCSNAQNELFSDKSALDNTHSDAFSQAEVSSALEEMSAILNKSLETSCTKSTEQDLNIEKNNLTSDQMLQTPNNVIVSQNCCSSMSTSAHKCSSCTKIFPDDDHREDVNSYRNIETELPIDYNQLDTSLQLSINEGPLPEQNIMLNSNEYIKPQNFYLDVEENNNSNTSTLSNESNTPTSKNSLDTDISCKLWQCNTCSKSFTTKYFLKKHKRLHTGEMPYTCEICGRSFTFQQSYHKHLMYHSDEKPHVCSTCGRAFKELSTLHNHERIHSGEKPYKCEVCGKCFRQRVSFLVHNRIHTGVLPYKCETCNKSFRYKVTQRTHKCQFNGSATNEETHTSLNNSKGGFEGVNQIPNILTLTNGLSSVDLSSKNGADHKMEVPHESPTALNDILLSCKDNYLPLIDMQNIHLFSTTENEDNSFSHFFH